MLTPEYLSSVPDRLVELYAQVEADILSDMARRINAYDMFIPAAQHQMQVLEEMGNLREDIIARLQKASGKSREELERIMVEAGMETLKRDDAIYKAVGLSPGPLRASPTMQSILTAGLEKTGGLFDNLTRTTANTATRQFERVLDSAYMKVTSGAFSPDAAVKSAIRELCKEGVGAITYPSGHSDTMEVAVRRATITGVNQTAGKLQEARADEMGCELVEVTAHSGARPEHAKWQGQIYGRRAKTEKYPYFVEETGYGTGAGLMGWNCSHSFRPYFEGMPRAYSDEMLEEYTAQSYEYNGVKMTEYEALQEQRRLERGVRRWKRENIAMSAAGQDTTESALKLKQWRDKEADFLSQTGLKKQALREHVGGWNRSVAGKASHDARVLQKMKNDAIIKAGSTLPPKVFLSDTTVKSTVELVTPAQSFLVPSGVSATTVYSMAGPANKKQVDDWKRLYNQYGGDPTQYQKLSGEVITDNYKYVVHWYEIEGRQIEPKIARVKEVN